MTAAELRALPLADLEAHFRSLRATTAPRGVYDGTAWGTSPIPWTWRGGWAWNGKVFAPWSSLVRNRMFGRELVEGYVVLDRDTVVIRYPQLRLTDHLKPESGTLWLGRTVGWPVWFTLEAVNPINGLGRAA